MQEVGLSSIKVEYSRPSVRDRKIFGDLVPYKRIWRVGANQSTKISLDTDMTVMGHVIPKGTYALSGQLQHPKASPFATTMQEVGLSSIKVEYSRPSVRDRKIFGDLVPYNRIWRVGANESTKISLDTDMTVMGHVLPKGTYALYAFPEEKSWQIVFHKNTQHWGDGRHDYDASEDLFRVSVTPETITYLQEDFLITFDNLQYNAVDMIWLWEHTKIRIPLSINTHLVMRDEIAQRLAENPSAQTYYEAARYLQEQGEDYNTALVYLNNALQLGGDTYYFHRVKSLVEAAMGDYAAAFSSAQKSMALATEEEKDEFVRMNQKNITLWNTLLTNPKE